VREFNIRELAIMLSYSMTVTTVCLGRSRWCKQWAWWVTLEKSLRSKLSMMLFSLYFGNDIK